VLRPIYRVKFSCQKILGAYQIIEVTYRRERCGRLPELADSSPAGGKPGVGREREEGTVKSATLLGIILIILGVLALAYQGITYTTREKVVDLGPLKITADKEKSIPLPPILGALALAGGIVLVFVGVRKS